MDTMWIMSSKEFIAESHPNQKGQNAGKRSIWFNGKSTKAKTEHVRPQFQRYVAQDFNRILNDDPDQ